MSTMWKKTGGVWSVVTAWTKFWKKTSGVWNVIGNKQKILYENGVQYTVFNVYDNTKTRTTSVASFEIDHIHLATSGGWDSATDSDLSGIARVYTLSPYPSLSPYTKFGMTYYTNNCQSADWNPLQFKYGGGAYGQTTIYAHPVGQYKTITFPITVFDPADLVIQIDSVGDNTALDIKITKIWLE
jgi:hypothetical protein